MGPLKNSFLRRAFACECRPPRPATLGRFASVAALVIGHWSLVIPEARSAPQVTATAPIKNFRLPTFTTEGFRYTMLRAGEARLPDPSRVDVLEMELTLFTGLADEQIDAMLAAPSASFFPQKRLATGASTVRLERRDLTVTGADWSYDHAARVITIRRDAHVTLRATIGNILQ